MNGARCPHVPAEHAQRWAPVECPTCLGWVDHDGSLISADLARQKYPAAQAVIDQFEPRLQAAREASTSGRSGLSPRRENYCTKAEYRWAKKLYRRQFRPVALLALLVGFAAGLTLGPAIGFVAWVVVLIIGAAVPELG